MGTKTAADCGNARQGAPFWFTAALLLIILISSVIRIYGAYTTDLVEKQGDGYVYYLMATSLVEHGELRGYDGNISHHYPPMYPFYLAVFIFIFGPEQYVVHTASLLMYFFSILVVYLCSMDILKDRDKALLITAFLSMDWMLVWTSWHNYTENMVILTYSLTIWAIYKSIEEQKYIILAGVFAGIGYLTKSSMGFFFIIAGLCGFAWRFYFMRWKLFKNIYYITAVGIFALFVVSWAIRNLYHFWDGTLLGLLTQWQTSESIAEATAEAFHQPSVFLLGLFIKTVFFALLYSYMCILWVTPLKKNLVLLLCCINDKSVLAEPPSAGRRLIGKDELCNTTGIT